MEPAIKNFGRPFHAVWKRSTVILDGKLLSNRPATHGAEAWRLLASVDQAPLGCQASQDVDSGAALPFVLVAESRIAGYYTLSSYGIRADDIPREQVKQLRLPRYEVIGATLLGRLARDLTFKGQGIGEVLLLDAMKKALYGSRTIAASTGLVVDAKDDNAQRFYSGFGFFAPFPDTPKRLFLRMETSAELLDRLFPPAPPFK